MHTPANITELYARAQHAMANLKTTVHALLCSEPEGMTNAEIGRTLGIYQGHIGHEGHVPRTLLAIMEEEGVVEQDKESKKWRCRHTIDGQDSQ